MKIRVKMDRTLISKRVATKEKAVLLKRNAKLAAAIEEMMECCGGKCVEGTGRTKDCPCTYCVGAAALGHPIENHAQSIARHWWTAMICREQQRRKKAE